MSKKKIGITEVVLRDAHQSLLATRLRYEDMEQSLKELDSIGFWSVESWGGAIFEIGRAHVRTPVTRGSRMPSSA